MSDDSQPPATTTEPLTLARVVLLIIMGVLIVGLAALNALRPDSEPVPTIVFVILGVFGAGSELMRYIRPRP